MNYRARKMLSDLADREAVEAAADVEDDRATGEVATDGGSRWHAGSAAEFRAELYETPATASVRREDGAAK